MSHSAFIGIFRHHLGRLVAELAGPWQAGRESGLRDRRGRDRLRAAGAGRGHDLVFTGRVLVTLAVLRLLAGRGYATPAGPRLHTLADVFAYAAAHGVRLRLGGSEIQVRRPKAHRPAGGRSCPGRRSRTQSRSPRSATSAAAPWPT